MAASLRLLYAGKKLPYVTALKAVARDAGHYKERRACIQQDYSPNRRPETGPQPQSLEDSGHSNSTLLTIGYEDKRQPKDKPKPSHPGEYVTAWGDFRPQPPSRPTQKRTAPIATTTVLKRTDWDNIRRAIFLENESITAFLADQSNYRLHEAPSRTIALAAKQINSISKKSIVSAWPVSVAGSGWVEFQAEALEVTA